ncbi:MAG TPA: DUF6677 family protein, partial [Pirellulaceae bacterium]
HDPDSTDPSTPVDVDLRHPGIAAILAWLWPGAGHLYQRRYGKALLFMTCIMGLYVWGLAIGDGQVVYAAFPNTDGGIMQALRSQEMRYPFFLQMGVGLPVFPALVQAYRVSHDLPPLFGNEFLAPPRGPIQEQRHDALAMRHEKLKSFFELGTLFTMIAGILNVFAIYDARYGPAYPPPTASAQPPTRK